MITKRRLTAAPCGGTHLIVLSVRWASEPVGGGESAFNSTGSEGRRTGFGDRKMSRDSTVLLVARFLFRRRV
jgi:hypothetical protein